MEFFCWSLSRIQKCGVLLSERGYFFSSYFMMCCWGANSSGLYFTASFVLSLVTSRTIKWYFQRQIRTQVTFQTFQACAFR